MARALVVVNGDLAKQAKAILGTTTLRETIDAALREVVNAQRRLELIDLLAEPDRFDFGATNRA